MRGIGAFEAKNTFSALLDQVEHGAEIVTSASKASMLNTALSDADFRVATTSDLAVCALNTHRSDYPPKGDTTRVSCNISCLTLSHVL
jgi:hypothetical protein